jgi:hypothetical protein
MLILLIDFSDTMFKEETFGPVEFDRRKIKKFLSAIKQNWAKCFFF